MLSKNELLAKELLMLIVITKSSPTQSSLLWPFLSVELATNKSVRHCIKSMMGFEFPRFQYRGLCNNRSISSSIPETGCLNYTFHGPLIIWEHLSMLCVSTLIFVIYTNILRLFRKMDNC